MEHWSDLPAEPTSGMAEAYDKLAHEARQRATTETDPQLRAQLEAAAKEHERRADAYRLRHAIS